jgi:hypothetical protein
MANKEWRVRGSVFVTGLSSIVLDQTTAELTDQDDIKMYKVTLSPGESFTPNLTSFQRIRSIVLVADVGVDVAVNGGVARPNTRLIIEWAEAGGSLLDDILITNPALATTDADLTLVLGGDGV